MKATTFLYKFYTLQFHVFIRAKGFSVSIKVSGINSRHLQILTVTFSFPVFTSLICFACLIVVGNTSSDPLKRKQAILVSPLM